MNFKWTLVLLLLISLTTSVVAYQSLDSQKTDYWEDQLNIKIISTYDFNEEIPPKTIVLSFNTQTQTLEVYEENYLTPLQEENLMSYFNQNQNITPRTMLLSELIDSVAQIVADNKQIFIQTDIPYEDKNKILDQFSQTEPAKLFSYILLTIIFVLLILFFFKLKDLAKNSSKKEYNLQTYLKQMLYKGYSKKQITFHLVRNGYPQAQIEEAFKKLN